MTKVRCMLKKNEKMFPTHPAAIWQMIQEYPSPYPPDYTAASLLRLWDLLTPQLKKWFSLSCIERQQLAFYYKRQHPSQPQSVHQSDKWYRSILCCTTRLDSSFTPQTETPQLILNTFEFYRKKELQLHFIVQPCDVEWQNKLATYMFGEIMVAFL